MDKIATLSSFVAAVDLGSFSAAANSLGISQPAVSQQVRALERQLGARLLNRTTRRLATTEAGERYYIHARDILERLAEADQSVRRFDDEMTGCLSIGAAPGFSEGLLADFFIGFQKRNPKLCLNLLLSDNFQDLIHEGLDVAIRLGDIRDDRLIVKKLGLAERSLAAAPEYLDTHGRPEVPEDLVRHRYLLYSQLQTGHDVPLTNTDGERRTVRITPTLRANNSSLLRRAALAGLGIGLAQNWLLDPLVKEGQLEYVLPDWSYAPQPVHAVYPSNRYIPLKVRHFVEEISGFFIEQGAVKNR